jgi:hypothetical protein
MNVTGRDNKPKQPFKVVCQGKSPAIVMFDPRGWPANNPVFEIG